MPKRARYSAASGTFATERGFRPSRTSRLRSRQIGRSSRLRSRNALVSVPRNKLGFPQEMATTLRYVKSFDLEPVTNNAVGISLLANDLYDPEVTTGTGQHQPRGFDEYMAQYTKFTVRASKISVTFTYRGYNGPPPGASDSTGAPVQQIQDTGAYVIAPPSVIGLVHKAVTTNANADIEEFQEQDRTKWATITPQGEARTVSTGLTCREFFGKDFLVGADGYTGTDGSRPDHLLYYHIMCGKNDDGASAKVHVRANCIIEYKCVFTEPKQLGQST